VTSVVAQTSSPRLAGTDMIVDNPSRVSSDSLVLF